MTNVTRRRCSVDVYLASAVSCAIDASPDPGESTLSAQLLTVANVSISLSCFIFTPYFFSYAYSFTLNLPLQ